MFVSFTVTQLHKTQGNVLVATCIGYMSELYAINRVQWGLVEIFTSLQSPFISFISFLRLINKTACVTKQHLINYR